MNPQQALQIISEFRSRASLTNGTGRDFDTVAQAIQVIAEALKPKEEKV